MKKRWDKSAFFDVDWAISLGIFLLYIAFFFIFITQQSQPKNELSALSGIVESNAKADLDWQVDRIPIYIESEISLKNAPNIAYFPFNYTKQNFTVNLNFDLDGPRMIFLADLEPGINPAYISVSNTTYDNSLPYLDLEYSPDYAGTQNNTFQATFSGGILSNIQFRDFQNIEGFSLISRNFTFPINASSYSGSRLFARFTSINDYYTLDSYILARNTRMDSILTPNVEDDSVNVTLSSRLPLTYTNYFVNNLYSGAIVRNSSACGSYDWNYIDLYDANEGISLIINKTSAIKLCYTNTTINLNITFPLKDTRFSIISHVGDYNMTKNLTNYVKYRYGIRQKEAGISLSLAAGLNSSDYTSLKTRWGYPKEREFSFVVKNSSYSDMVSYKPVEPRIIDDVYVDESYCQILTANGTKQRCRLLIKTW